MSGRAPPCNQVDRMGQGYTVPNSPMREVSQRRPGGCDDTMLACYSTLDLVERGSQLTKVIE